MIDYQNDMSRVEQLLQDIEKLKEENHFLKEEIIFKSSDYEQTEICCHYCGSHRLDSYFFTLV